MSINKIIVILGQTATGKSDFAVEIAKKVNGEVVSADSRQVYRGMNLGTGKITKSEMRGIPHHLLDVISPKKVFSVADYKKLADKKIEEIIKKDKVPIICGGTGFYIDALVNSINLPEVPPNKILCKKLAKKSTAQLFEMLKGLDQTRAKNIDCKNKVRIIRAIEIVKFLGKVPKITKEDKYKVLKIGLTLPDETLKEKIYSRLLYRIKKGMLREINNLHKQGISWKRIEALGLEYRYGALHLQGKLTKEEMTKKIDVETWHYAKRQKTWLKRDKDIIWIDPREIVDKNKMTKRVMDFLK